MKQGTGDGDLNHWTGTHVSLFFYCSSYLHGRCLDRWCMKAVGASDMGVVSGWNDIVKLPKPIGSFSSMVTTCSNDLNLKAGYLDHCTNRLTRPGCLTNDHLMLTKTHARSQQVYHYSACDSHHDVGVGKCLKKLLDFPSHLLHLTPRASQPRQSCRL